MVGQDAAVADELDTGAVLSATDRLMRTPRGPLGGAASWEWSDLLAAATGRSPFEFTSLARGARLAVPDPSNVEPADIAAQLLRVAHDMEPTDRARVTRVARLLDPSLPDHDLPDADTHSPLEDVASGAPPVDQPRAAEPVPTPPLTQQPTTPPWEPAPADPGPSPHPAFRTGPPHAPGRGPAAPPPAAPTAPSDMHFPKMSPVDPSRTVPDAQPKKKNPVGRLIWLGVLAFLVIRGLVEGDFGWG